MIDIHSHIIPNIDDGSGSYEESLKILRNAYKNGVTDIVLTPHYIIGSIYASSYSKNKELFNTLKSKLEEEKIALNLYLGNEIFVDNDMVGMLKEGKISSLNNTRYVLFELPMNSEYKRIKELLFDLQSNGYTPIIAHPERYRIIKEDPRRCEELIEAGALFQSNIGSLFGRYGKEAKITLKILLKHKFITFLASDIHHDRDDFYNEIKPLEEKLNTFLDKDYVADLFVNNAKKVLCNKKIEERETTPIKKNFLKKFY